MRIIAVDYGDSRTGVAVSDMTNTLAGEIFTINEKSVKALILKLTEIATAKNAELFIVGLPKNMNGTEGSRAEKTRAFAEKLQKESQIPCRFWDERLTSIDAARMLHISGKHGAKNREHIDAVSAALILEGYLRQLKP